MSSEIRERVLAVYREVDAAITAARPRCDASGRCCRFREYGHTLFLSQFEADILLETAPAYEKPVSRDGCPFQVQGLCTAREERPLGCRIYFCDPAFEQPQQEITEKAIADLKKIADEFNVGWHYAPLHYFLNAAERSVPPRPAASDGRIALPITPDRQDGPP